MSHRPMIALTGGGTAGHVMPHLALLESYRAAKWDVFYIGSKGIEEELARDANIPFFRIQSGKLRRYFSWQNFTDIFRILVGTLQALYILTSKRPRLVFSKGGFVSVPVCAAAWVLRIPVVSHESDLTPGLATKLITPLAAKIFYSFPETSKFVPKGKGELVGLPIRQELLTGDRARGLELCGFSGSVTDPVILVMGGSLGAQKINEALAGCLSDLVRDFYVIHITGKGKKIDFVHDRYKAFEYVKGDLKHLFAATDLIVGRAGANSIFEFLALQKPMLLIPLVAGSRGDQVDNAENFSRNGWALMEDEKKLTPERLQTTIRDLRRIAPAMKSAQSASKLGDANAKVIKLITPMVKN